MVAPLHTKKRTCLSLVQLKKLVFANCNLKLLQKRERIKAINEIDLESLKVEICMEELVHP